jgi:hypothetical protein
MYQLSLAASKAWYDEIYSLDGWASKASNNTFSQKDFKAHSRECVVYKEQTEQDNKCLVHCGKKLTRTPSHRSSICVCTLGHVMAITLNWPKHCVTGTSYRIIQLSKEKHGSMDQTIQY